MPLDTFARLHATLTPDERDRSARFRFERDRRRFVVARGALRDILGRYLGNDAGGIRFVYGSSGKPGLGPRSGGPLEFNLAHSAGLAVIAVAYGSRVGVDLETIRPDPDYPAIARRFFPAAEADALRAVRSPHYARAFLRRWTRMEAYLKARGEGLSAADTVPEVLGECWSFHTLRPAPGFIGALVIEGGGHRLSERRWWMRS